MRIPRIYLDLPLTPGATVSLDKNAANHVCRVLRMQAGERLVLFNGSGGEYDAVLVNMARSNTTALLETYHARDSESALPITLVQAVSRGERMDYTMQKSVELGVQEIIPVFSEHGTVQLKDERLLKKRQHWQAIVVSACEQSGRTRVPMVHTPVALEHYLRDTHLQGTGILLDPMAAQGLATIARPAAAVTLLIGPEGGLATGEIAMAHACGFVGVRLGPRILRTETAAIAACAAMQALWGDFS